MPEVEIAREKPLPFKPSGGGFGGGLGGGGMPSGGSMPSGGGMPSFSGGGMPGGMSFCDDDRMNQENITLSTDDMEDLLVFVPGIADATISYTTTVDVEGGDQTLCGKRCAG